MARTYLSGDNSRGGSVTGANASYAHLRGWNAGVYTELGPRTDDGRDTFDVYMSGGSHGAARGTFLGRVTDTPEGSKWEPARAGKSARA